LREQLNVAQSPSSNESNAINVYYGCTIMRFIPLLDYVNYRYMELNQHVAEADPLLDSLNRLYKFHSNPISFVYNSFMYFRNGSNENLNTSQSDEALKMKRKKIFQILVCK
jgi:hypothetical protein